MRHLKYELSIPFLWIQAHFCAQWDTLPQVWATAVKLIMNCRLVMFYCNSPHDNEAAHIWGERATATIWEYVPQGWSRKHLDRAPDLFHLIPLKIAPARVFSTNHWVVQCVHTHKHKPLHLYHTFNYLYSHMLHMLIKSSWWGKACHSESRCVWSEEQMYNFIEAFIHVCACMSWLWGKWWRLWEEAFDTLTTI